GMLYLRNLVQFDTKEAMFNSDLPVVRQFLAGSTKGPIGMSEEADQTKPTSTSGMSYEETEELERVAGAPEDNGHAHGNGRRIGDVRGPGVQADPRGDRRHGGAGHRPGPAPDHAADPRGHAGGGAARRHRVGGRDRRRLVLRGGRAARDHLQLLPVVQRAL